MQIKNNIILALDLTNLPEALQVADDVTDYIDTIKIGYPLVLAEGLECIHILKEEINCKVIADFKVADIPETNQKITDLTFLADADAIIVHGFTGRDSVKAALVSADNYGRDVFLVTEMSHPGAEIFMRNVSEDIARMGLDMGITNYVAPSTKLDRLKRIRGIVGDNSLIISPGVGVQGGDPASTLKYADALIIGRSIYTANNPKQALQSIIDSIKL
ncbi:MAG: orotidine-5'-phosphate decarboxylase [Methanobacterium sp.]